jgi:hypothetical protein
LCGPMVFTRDMNGILVFMPFEISCTSIVVAFSHNRRIQLFCPSWFVWASLRA